jgi:serine protease Do
VRGYLGVGLQAVDEDLAPSLGRPKDSGEIIRTIVPDGPAAKGNLQVGDVIVKVNGQQVTPNETVSYLIANSPVGQRIPLEIVRSGKRATVYVTLQDRPTEEALSKIAGGNTPTPDTNSGAATTAQKALGLSLSRLTPELARSANLPATARGVIITGVDSSSDAAEQGLQRGDLIVSVNNQAVSDPAQVIAGVDAARKAGRTSVLLLIKRGNSPEAFVAVSIK